MDFLKQQIEAAPDGNIRVGVEEIAKAMGMTGRHETSIYWGLKYTLFSEGIVVNTGQTKEGAPVLIMREKVEGDKLPDSLAKHLGGDAEAGTEEKEE